jgi:hypothetical protein
MTLKNEPVGPKKKRKAFHSPIDVLVDLGFRV